MSHCASCSPLHKNDYTLKKYNINKANKWSNFRDKDNGIFFIHPGTKSAAKGVFTFNKNANLILTFSIRPGSKTGDIKFTIKKNTQEIKNFITTTTTINKIFIKVEGKDTLTITADKHGGAGYDWGNLKMENQPDLLQFTLLKIYNVILIYKHKIVMFLFFLIILLLNIEFRNHSTVRNFHTFIFTENSKIINYLIILYALMIPLSLDILRATSILMIIFWIREGRFTEKFSDLKKQPLFISLFLLICLLVLSLLWTDYANLRTGIKYITRYWYLIPMLIIYTSIEKKNIPIVLSAFLLGMFISELVSYGIFFEIIHWNGLSTKDPTPFMHHTLYSIFLVLTAGILLNKLFTSISLSHKVGYLLFFITVTSNLFINSGRTGQFLFFLVLIAVIINHYKINLKSIVLIIILSFLIPYLAFTFSPNFHQRMLQSYNSLSNLSYNNSSIGIRIGLVVVSKDIFLEHPIVGVGVGDYLIEKAKTVQTKYPESEMITKQVHYHNQYIEFLVIAGILGLFSYLLIFITFGRTLIKESEIKTIKIIFILTFTVASLADATFHLNRSMSLFALFAGLIVAKNRSEREEAIDRSLK